MQIAALTGTYEGIRGRPPHAGLKHADGHNGRELRLGGVWAIDSMPNERGWRRGGPFGTMIPPS
jgi:hypothetical protein